MITSHLDGAALFSSVLFFGCVTALVFKIMERGGTAAALTIISLAVLTFLSAALDGMKRQVVREFTESRWDSFLLFPSLFATAAIRVPPLRTVSNRGLEKTNFRVCSAERNPSEETVLTSSAL